jgi:hypothetical protein
MKLLLDECVPIELEKPLGQEHECRTITKHSPFRGLKNGALLRAAEQDGIDVIITVDKSFAYQQI